MAEVPQADVIGLVATSDPHQELARIRRESPVCRSVLSGGTPVWMVTRYEDAMQVLADPRLSIDGERTAKLKVFRFPPEMERRLNRHLLAADPPAHSRLRRLLAAAFTPRRIGRLRPRIQQLVDGMLDSIAGMDGTVDLSAELAFPLPIAVFGELFGVPEQDRAQVGRWTDQLIRGGTLDRVYPAVQELETYILSLIERRSSTPADDLISALLAAHDGTDKLTTDELCSMVFLLLMAGFETTANLIANGLYTLLTRPKQLVQLRADPAMLPAAIEEFLRLETPVAATMPRATTEPITVGGVTIPADQLVLVSLLTANRDDTRFDRPDECDFARQDNRHLSFGHGIHFCIGAALARLQAEVAISSVLARFPDVRLAVPAEQLLWRPGGVTRSLSELPVVLG